MRFVVIEGLDGSGKSTQISLFREYLQEKGIKYKYLHFPRTDSSFYGEMVARFLRGEFGEINQVNPYLVAMIFAADRNDAKEKIKSWVDEGYFVLLDRYVNSNIAFQCAKLNTVTEKERLKEWILKLEYEYNRLPRPDISIFLDVPFNFTKSQLSFQRNGSDREYLKGASDIHEGSLEFQQEVKKIYHSLEGMEDYQILNCSDNQGNMLNPDEVFNKIKKTVFANEND